MTVFKSRSFGYPKDPENPQQNQDSFQISEATGSAVVADGVSSAIFSAAWANILTKHIIQEHPTPTNATDFAQWLANLRTEWEQSIDATNLSWFQRPKMAAGAFSTLLWVQVREIAPPKPGSNLWNRLQNPDVGRRCFHVKGHCIGDSCLFHIRPGRTDSEKFSGSDLYRALPISSSTGFDLPPVVIGSKDLGRDDQMKFQPIDFLAQEGDLVVLATDAVSQWLLRCYETQAFPCWDLFWNLTQEQWGQELDAMRSAGEIRYDDSTLVLLQLGSSKTFLNQPTAVEETVKEIPAETVSRASTISEPEFTPEPETISELVFSPEPEAVSEPEFTPEPETMSEPVFSPEPETVSEPGSSAEPETVSEPEFSPEPETVSGPGFSFDPKTVTKETLGRFSNELPTKSSRTFYTPISHPATPKRPISNPGATPQAGGFQYRMASSETARKFEPAQGARPDVEDYKPSGTHRPATTHHPVNTQKPEIHQSSILNAEDAAKLSENWKQFKESSSQLAGIIGEHLGEKISDEMNRLGTNLNEGVSQLSESAKPKLQSMTQRFTSLFTRKKVEKPEDAEEPEEKPTENKTPGRIIDPNRRRFYNPPPRE